MLGSRSGLPSSSAFLGTHFSESPLVLSSYVRRALPICCCSLLSTCGSLSPFLLLHVPLTGDAGAWCSRHLWFCLTAPFWDVWVSAPAGWAEAGFPGFRFGEQWPPESSEQQASWVPRAASVFSHSLNSLICLIAYDTMCCFKVSHVLACEEKKKKPQTGGLGSARGFYCNNTSNFK